MSLTNNTTILAADLQALTTTARAALQLDSAQLPLGWLYSAQFAGLTLNTTLTRRRTFFTAPFDCTVESFGVTAYGFDALSIGTVNITAPGVLASFPLQQTGSIAGTGPTRLSRVFYDGAKGKTGAQYMTLNPAVRMLYAGTRCTITVATTVNLTTTSHLQVAIALRQFFARGA
jgi:hypothetical protein